MYNISDEATESFNAIVVGKLISREGNVLAAML